MSEDEAINFLKNIVKQNGDLDTHTTVPFYKKEAKAIETILDLYQKEKEKNKELEDITRAYNGMKGIMPEGNPIVIADKEYFDSGRFVERYISKDKIRAKIEEVKRKREEEWETAGISMLGSAIDVLNELLEENEGDKALRKWGIKWTKKK